ncbi:hypothetical protein Z968_01560 [Clostridium novyi A str. 4552]|uniref:VTT domain-containing protein n=1 Tax=Clostridium novyi A str. 4552 TaxID=1444289 RepID=A0A0A0I975_CLONO|nr:VTT domain-containing protein [Clostridium novyi]KGM98034.1 hypothetical protein Z968_01560 [Clostridium novyi A str. 4552]
MDIRLFLNFLMNLDKYLYIMVQRYGIVVYAIIFTIIFLEAGIIVMAFLPGDSLIFIIGTLTSIKVLKLILVIPILFVAVILGDVINYSIGKILGHKLINRNKGIFIKKNYLEKAHNFYGENGRISIILGRFIPVVRSFVAFVAGIATMNFNKFILYCIVGGSLRVIIFLFGGYYLGTFEIVKNNLEIIIAIIMVISIIPGIIGFMKKKSSKKSL